MSAVLSPNSPARAIKRFRPRFRLKSDWADWEAAEIEERIRQIESEYIPSYKSSRVQQKMRVLSELRAKAAEYRSKARKYRTDGV